jgi:microcystin-dependent protein
MDVFVGEIRLFPYNFAPLGWLDCDGSLISIAEYEILFTLLGTTYGGNGQTTFAVPDLRGRIPLNQGNGPGLTSRVLGQENGSESVTLTTQQMAAHNHIWTATAATVTSGTPAPNLELGAVTGTNTAYATNVAGLNPAPLAGGSVSVAGGGQPHDNMMPTTTLRFCIATAGIFPSQS